MSQQDCCFVNPSYFYFTESEYRGWNGSYYFTYFTEYSNTTSNLRYIEAGFFISNCILSCLLNSLILFSMTNNELRNVSNVFILNMTVADLIYGLVGPVLAVVRLTEDWNLGDAMCHLVFYLQSVCGSVVSWSIAAVAVDRYVHIVHPMCVRVTISVQHATIMACVIWLFSLVFMSPLGVFFQVIERPIPHSPGDTAHVCTLVWPLEVWEPLSTVSTLVVTTTVFILPVGLMTWCYFRCAKRMKTISKSITMRMDSIGSHSSCLDVKRRRSIRDYRVIRTFMILLVAYILAWGPLFTLFPIILSDMYEHTTIMRSQAFVWTVALAHFNTVVNPVIYGLSMRNVRTNIIRRFRNMH